MSILKSVKRKLYKAQVSLTGIKSSQEGKRKLYGMQESAKKSAKSVVSSAKKTANRVISGAKNSKLAAAMRGNKNAAGPHKRKGGAAPTVKRTGQSPINPNYQPKSNAQRFMESPGIGSSTKREQLAKQMQYKRNARKRIIQKALDSSPGKRWNI